MSKCRSCSAICGKPHWAVHRDSFLHAAPIATQGPQNIHEHKDPTNCYIQEFMFSAKSLHVCGLLGPVAPARCLTRNLYGPWRLRHVHVTLWTLDPIGAFIQKNSKLQILNSKKHCKPLFINAQYVGLIQG